MSRSYALAGVACLLVFVSASMVLAHASEQGFVLLLPTDIYIAAGVTSVAATVVLLAFLPGTISEGLFHAVRLWRKPRLRWQCVTCACSTAVMLWLIWQGVFGPRDPLANPMPLVFWTVFWIVLVTLQGIFGNLWRWIDPFRVPCAMAAHVFGSQPPFKFPSYAAYWPALVGFLAFAGFLLADIAPTDPDRLARVVAFYFFANLVLCALFGARWMVRGEFVSVLMRTYGRLGVSAVNTGQKSVGLWGWQYTKRAAPPLSLAVFCVVLLGTGSFDGINETFWWIDLIGLNPLEFPGRSFVFWQNIFGLVIANALLVSIFAFALWTGAQAAGDRRPMAHIFCAFAPSILPIALGYHIAHYLTAFLVDGQYVLKMLDDPLGKGWHLLGLQDFFVTTGFFNTQNSVELIWLTQAGAVVLGHIIAVLMAHRIALRDGASSWSAFLGQMPLALFMIAYTFLGLWLLATPRGA
ncbi:MAG: hypothetical protein AAGF53_09310 [Pseudomonadota bacterium]